MLRATLLLTMCLIHTLAVLGMKISFEVDSISCNGGNDGKVIVTISETNQLYTIRLMEEKNNRQVKRFDLFSDTTISFTGLKAGKFILQSIYNGKSEEKLIEIAQPSKLEGNIIIEKYPSSKESCDGVIYLEPSGGKKPYKFKWNDNNEELNEERLTDLCEKIYSCELVDSNGCRRVVATTFLYLENSPEEKK